jgi:hypothetical protein
MRVVVSAPAAVIISIVQLDVIKAITAAINHVTTRSSSSSRRRHRRCSCGAQAASQVTRRVQRVNAASSAARHRRVGP